MIHRSLEAAGDPLAEVRSMPRARARARWVRARAVGTSRGPSFCVAYWNDGPTAPCALEALGHFSITHPFHPLRSRQFKIVQVRRSRFGDRVYFRVEGDDRTRILPLSWTSLAPVDPFLDRSAGRASFRVEDLLCLVDLVGSLRQRREEGGEDEV